MKRIDSINVIPLIDIMLVMLAIVLTTATFIKVGKIDVELPSASTAVLPANDSGLVISVNAKGQLFFGESLTTVAILDSEFSSLKKDTLITLQVDRRAEFGAFTEVVDLLNRHGLDNLSVLVNPVSE